MITKVDKAIVAFVLAAAGALGSQQVTGDGVSTQAIVAALVVGLIAALGVWLTPNKPAAAPAVGPSSATSPSPPPA